MPKYVYSTLAADVEYPTYSNASELPVVTRTIRIAGKAGVALGKAMITSLGAVTKIENEDAQILMAHPVFKLHHENGFVKIEDTKGDPDEVALDMTIRDNSAPLIDEDFTGDLVPKHDAKPANPAATQIHSSSKKR